MGRGGRGAVYSEQGKQERGSAQHTKRTHVIASLPASREILPWLEEGGRTIRVAGEEDIALVQKLKDKVLKESFASFLYEDELHLERGQVASKETVEKMIRENTVFLAEKESKVWAMFALSGEEEDTDGKRYRKIFSGYSRGERAAPALGLRIISEVGDLDYLLAWVYRDNEQSKRAMTSFGFSDKGESHTNKLVPRVPVEHWSLPLR